MNEGFPSFEAEFGFKKRDLSGEHRVPINSQNIIMVCGHQL